MRYLKLSFGSNNGKNEQPKPVTPQQLTIDRKQTYILRDENGVKNYKVADCCCPIPGDDVLGYVEDDETVVVHKKRMSRSHATEIELRPTVGVHAVGSQRIALFPGQDRDTRYRPDRDSQRNHPGDFQ